MCRDCLDKLLERERGVWGFSVRGLWRDELNRAFVRKRAALKPPTDWRLMGHTYRAGASSLNPNVSKHKKSGQPSRKHMTSMACQEGSILPDRCESVRRCADLLHAHELLLFKWRLTRAVGLFWDEYNA